MMSFLTMGIALVSIFSLSSFLLMENISVIMNLFSKFTSYFAFAFTFSTSKLHL